MSLYTVICLTVLCGLIDTTEIQTDFYDRPDGCEFCNKSWHLTKKDIDNLSDNLFRYWPSLTNFTPFKFWANEWCKHGTCAAYADSMSTPHKYFSLALQLRMKFPINKAFVAAGITPSCDNGYMLNHFHTALTDFGTQVSLQCYKSMGRQILMQIKMFLSKDLSIGCKHSEDNFNKPYYYPCTNHSEIYYYPLTDHPHEPCP